MIGTFDAGLIALLIIFVILAASILVFPPTRVNKFEQNSQTIEEMITRNEIFEYASSGTYALRVFFNRKLKTYTSASGLRLPDDTIPHNLVLDDGVYIHSHEIENPTSSPDIIEMFVIYERYNDEL